MNEINEGWNEVKNERKKRKEEWKRTKEIQNKYTDIRIQFKVSEINNIE